MGREDRSVGGCQAAQARTRDIESIDSELRLVAALRRAARERGGPLPSIDEADAAAHYSPEHMTGAGLGDGADGRP